MRVSSLNTVEMISQSIEMDCTRNYMSGNAGFFVAQWLELRHGLPEALGASPDRQFFSAGRFAPHGTLNNQSELFLYVTSSFETLSLRLRYWKIKRS